MIYNISICPNVFEYDFFKNSFYARHLIKLIPNHSFFIYPTQKYFELIYSCLHLYNENIKKDIEEFLETMYNRKRLYYCHNSDINEWNIDIDTIRNLLDYIFSKDNTFTNIETNFPNEINRFGASIDVSTSTILSDIFMKFIPYSRNIRVYDKYFNLLQDRFRDTLDILISSINNSCRENNNVEIILNTSIDRRRQYTQNDLQNIQNHIKNYSIENPNIYIEYRIWEERNNRWHDRYIITDTLAIHSGAGVDINNRRDSTFSIVEWDKISKIENKFEQNNPNSHNLKYVITKEEVKEI